MLAEPNCFTRGCKYFLGIIQPDGTEKSEVANCKAFPEGIPFEISYGENPHSEVQPGQEGDYIFEEGLQEEE